jgi:hypothetical protein
MSRKKFIGIRVTVEEDLRLRFESQRQGKSIAELIRSGILTIKQNVPLTTLQ